RDREHAGRDRGGRAPRARHGAGHRREGRQHGDGPAAGESEAAGLHGGDLSRLPEDCPAASRATGGAIPANYPVFGADAFRTGTGVHAAAIIKARAKGEDWLADRVYSGVPAGLFGMRQIIEISHVSGMSNVKHWLAENGYDRDDDGLCQQVFALAKQTARVLTDEELHACCRAYGATPARAATS